jgi:hypothetical protein
MMTDAIIFQLFYWLAFIVGVAFGYGIFKYRHTHQLTYEMPIIQVRQNG